MDPNPVLTVVVRLTAMPSPSMVHRCEVPWSGRCVPEVTFHRPPYTPMGNTPRSSIVALRGRAGSRMMRIHGDRDEWQREKPESVATGLFRAGVCRHAR